MPIEKEQENDKEREKIEAIKKLQIQNIDMALAADKKLEILKDKANELEERLRVFSKNTYDLKEQFGEAHPKKRKFILGGMIVFTLSSFGLKGSALGSMMNGGFHLVFGLLIGGGLGYGLYSLFNYLHKKLFHKPKDIKDIKEKATFLMSPSHAKAIHPLLDTLKKGAIEKASSAQIYDQSDLRKNSRYK